MKTNAASRFMIALALEFSSSQRSVAALDLPHPPAAEPAQVLSCAQERAPRAAGPLALVQRALAEAKLDRGAVECIVVGLGPGSYTGIRGAIAIAQGWQLACDVKLLGVSSVEALAWQAQKLGMRGTIHIAIDAQRHEFYLADYRIAGGVCERTAPVRLTTASELREIAAQDGHVVGLGLTRWFPNAVDLEPMADAVGLLAAGRGDFLAGEKLEPIYLREITFVKSSPPRAK